MSGIPLSFGMQSNRGRYGVDNSVLLMNCYAEPLGEGGKYPFALYAFPGLDPWARLPTRPWRGFLVVKENLLLVVSGQALYSVTPTGSVTRIASIPGAGPVSMAKNGRDIPDIMIVASGFVFHMKLATASMSTTSPRLTPFSQEGMPPPTFVMFQNGRFIFGIPDGRFYYSEIPVGLTDDIVVKADNVYSTQIDPDGLVSGFVRRQDLWFWNKKSFEVWSPTKDALDPYDRQGGGSRPFGILGPRAHTEINDRIFWADHECNIQRAEGYDPAPISSPYVSRLIEDEPDKVSIALSSYSTAGVSFVVVSGSSFTAVYNTKTQQWTNRRTGNKRRWRGAGAERFGNGVVVGDFETGDLYMLNKDSTRDGSDPIVMTLVPPIVHAWPAPLTIYSLHIDMMTGVGRNTDDPDQVDPQVMLRISENGGREWFGPLYEEIGMMGQQERIIFRDLGTFDRDGAVVEITIPAEVAKVVFQAMINGAAGVA